jgi:hypothetical protein
VASRPRMPDRRPVYPVSHDPHVHPDAERLKLLFDLFAETLDRLCRIGSAYEDAPAVGA